MVSMKNQRNGKTSCVHRPEDNVVTLAISNKFNVISIKIQAGYSEEIEN